MMKRIFFAALTACVLMVTDARAEMPQTDVQLIQQMGQADGEKILQTLSVFYDLHASELEVQYANEQLTGSFFDVQRATEDGASADEIAKLQKIQNDKRDQWDALVKQNQNLRKQLESLSGVEFLDNLMVTPDAPMNAPGTTVGVSSELVKERGNAYAEMQAADAALAQERLVLLDAQERFYAGQNVPIGDHLRAMTAAELAFTRAVSAYRLLEAKIAVATGASVAEVLGGL